MSSTSDIQAKFEELKARGLDLGAQVGTEQDTGSGGRVQVYRKGRIYWHPNTGAHEVHGAILTKYLKEGGPGAHPRTGQRHFGFPTHDEARGRDGLYPLSRFEFGEIVFVAGTGGVSIFGDFQKKRIRSLGYPLTEPLKKSGGEVVYFERGCLWRGPATNGEIITCTIEPPLLGRPALIDRDQVDGLKLVRFASWERLSRTTLDSINAKRPALFSELWNGQLVLRQVSKPGTPAEILPLLTREVTFEGDNATGATVRLDFAIPATSTAAPLRERGLYDLGLRLPSRTIYALAPHALYIRKAWESFGFIHATDIHVARRLEGFRARLRAIGEQDAQFAQAAEEFNNFNDGFRDLIRYANHLHDIGVIDFILATGDLVDYAFEEKGFEERNNYLFFEKLIRGQALSPDGVVSEELRVPIFTTMGNHDYRLNPYTIFSRLDIPLHADKDVPMYSSYNLTGEEAIALQGGKPKISLEKGQEMLEIDELNHRGSYDYYLNRINRETSYIVELGPHRIIMLDTGSDAGIPEMDGWLDILAALWNFISNDFSEDSKRAMDGGPNLLGFTPSDVALLRKGLGQAHPLGMVIVGLHAPPLNIEGSEFSHFLRETERPTADPHEAYAFLMRHMSSENWASVLMQLPPNSRLAALQARDVARGEADETIPDEIWSQIAGSIERVFGNANWLRSGTAHFKAGGIGDFLDDGIARGETEAFLKLCAGVGAPRLVDLVLCGHNHDRVEYRLKWDAAREEFRFFTDFYTENPATYYPSRKLGVHGPVHIRVKQGASLNGTPRKMRDHLFDPPLEFYELDVPPFAEPLDKAFNVRAWWEEHRPLIAETAALGPIDHSQRITGASKPSETFQGFRVMTVDGNVIHNIHYVTLHELRHRNFEMPWEPGAGSVGPITHKPPTSPEIGA